METNKRGIVKKVYIISSGDEPSAVLLAESKQLAEVAFAAMGHSGDIEEIDPRTSLGVGGVVFLLNSKQYPHHEIGRRDWRLWRRGR